MVVNISRKQKGKQRQTSCTTTLSIPSFPVNTVQLGISMARDRSLTPPRRHGESQKLTQDRGDRYDRRSSKYDPHDEDHDSSTRKRRRSRTRSRNRDGDPPSLKDGEHTGSRSR